MLKSDPSSLRISFDMLECHYARPKLSCSSQTSWCMPLLGLRWLVRRLVACDMQSWLGWSSLRMVTEMLEHEPTCRREEGAWNVAAWLPTLLFCCIVMWLFVREVCFVISDLWMIVRTLSCCVTWSWCGTPPYRCDSWSIYVDWIHSQRHPLLFIQVDVASWSIFLYMMSLGS
jgi:hypothetical protein